MLLKGGFMKFDHLVKHNGISYPAGTEVPVGVVAVQMTEDVPKSVLDKNDKADKVVKAQAKKGRNSKKA